MDLCSIPAIITAHTLHGSLILVTDMVSDLHKGSTTLVYAEPHAHLTTQTTESEDSAQMATKMLRSLASSEGSQAEMETQLQKSLSGEYLPHLRKRSLPEIK